MTDLHAEYAAAVRPMLRDLEGNWDGTLPRLLADWEAIAARHAAGTGSGTVIGQYPAVPPPDPEEPRPRRRTTRKAAGT